MQVPSPITPMPGKKTNKQLELQGWNAAVAGYRVEDCPYYTCSTAGERWLKGFRSASI